MHPSKLHLILLGSVGALVASAEAQNFGSPTLRYSFELDSVGVLIDGTAISNAGLVGGSGTFGGSGGGIGSIVATGTVLTPGYGSIDLGNTLTLTPSNDGNGSLNTPSINANAPVGSAGFGIQPDTAYTAFAWINFANQNSDNMVFGGETATSSETLHLGSRGANYHSGHWGGDLTSGTTDPGNWHLVAYLNDGPAGVQTIYVDPDTTIQQTFSGQPGGGAMNVAKNLYIGTAQNDASFNGQIDVVSVYNSVLTPAEIRQFATVPEPGTFVALVGGAALLTGLRRRRS